MSARTWAGALLTAGLALWLGAGLLALPPVGAEPPPYGSRLVGLALDERQTANAVSAVLFDLRALDTLAEALSLFAGAAAVQAVLRELSDEGSHEPGHARAPGRRPGVTTDAVRSVMTWLVAPTVLYGTYIAVRGHVSVGGGFQGGVIVSVAVALVLLAGHRVRERTLPPERALDVAESVGIGGFLLAGLLALAAGAGFLGNVLPLGDRGRLVSAGTIGVFSVLIAVAAAAAVATLIQKFTEQMTEVRQEGS